MKGRAHGSRLLGGGAGWELRLWTSRVFTVKEEETLQGIRLVPPEQVFAKMSRYLSVLCKEDS